MTEPAPPMDPSGAASAVMYETARGVPPPMPPAEPVCETERIESIDVLRGFAVMGILFVNIQYMAMPFQVVENLDWRDMAPLDGAARLIVQLFFELKFITLFSFLFGAGLAIMMERLERTGRPFVFVYVRRLLVLLVIGILHGVFLWYGDILAIYAVLGFGALLLRQCRPRTLLIVAGILFIIPIPVILGLAALDSTADWSTPSWSSIATEYASAASQATSVATTGSADISSETMTPEVVRFFEFLNSEVRVYQSGGFGERVALRSAYFVIVNLSALPFFYLWRCLAMFLAGMAAVKLRFFSADRSQSPRWGMAAVFFIAGLALEIYAHRFFEPNSRRAASVSLRYVLFYIGSLLLSATYALTILALAVRPAMRRVFHPVAAVGRMALTNYLAHSLIGGLIFYSHGLGLFGTVGSAELFGITVAILAAQLVYSPIWLRYFNFGPVEWLWRTATYGKAQPMRRPVG